MGRYWTEEELDYLDFLANRHHPRRVTALYNHQASIMGWPKRTYFSIWHKLRREYGTAMATLENFNMCALSKVLGVSYDRVQSWVYRGSLKTRKEKWYRIVTKQNLDEFLRDYPYLLCDCDYGGLLFLFGPDVADDLMELRKSRKINTNSVRLCHLETGRFFGSVTQASKDLNLTKYQIYKMIESEELEVIG